MYQAVWKCPRCYHYCISIKLLTKIGLNSYHVFTLDPVWAAGAVIQSALPTGALVFVLAQKYGVYLQRSTAVIMVSTVISLFTLSALLLFMGY